MKKFFFLLLLIPFFSTAQTSFSLAIMSADYLRPGSGAMNWNDGYVVPVPAGGSTGVNAGKDRYVRFSWDQLQNDDGTYNWTALDLRCQIAINNNQKFNIGWFGYAEGVFSNSTFGGTPCTYPAFLHTQMQGDADPDWNGGSTWVANGNNQHYLAAWKALLAAIANHIATTSYNGVAYSKVVGIIDVRVFGNFGEDHFYPHDNAGTSPNGQAMPSYIKPTQAACDSIISWYIKYFPNNPLTILHLFYGGVNSYTPAESIYYSLTAQNNFGPIGFRRDSWGDPSNYTYVMEGNTGSYLGFSFATAIMSRYKTSPVNGEPLNGLGSYHDLIAEMSKYGISTIADGNIANPTNPTVQADFQAAAKIAGARIQINSGTITAMHPGQAFQTNIQWQNTGSSPNYEKWNTDIEIRNGATVLQKVTSAMQMKLFLPGTKNQIDNFTLSGSIAPGTYGVFVKIRDSVGYRKAMQLSNTLMLADTSYQLATVTVTAAGANPPPTVSAGIDQAVTAPATTAVLNGSVTGNSPATSGTGVWSEVSGPTTVTFTPGTSTLNATVGNLAVGTYVLKLLGTDNLGGTNSDQMQIIVSAANANPNGSAGPNQTITLPVTSITNVADGSPVFPAKSVSFAWMLISKPSGAPTPTITPTNAAITVFGNLTTAGNYVFQVTITDDLGKFITSNVTITVSAALPACLCIPSTGLYHDNQKSPAAAFVWVGKLLYDSTLPACKRPTVTLTSNYTVPIILPISTVAFKYSGSSNNKGTGKMNLAFKQVSGQTATIVNSVGTSTVTKLLAGTYVFAIVATDDCGASATLKDTIVVLSAPVPSVYLTYVSYVPGEKQYNLRYSDGSVKYFNWNSPKTFMWFSQGQNPNGKGVILYIHYSDGTDATPMQ